MNLTDEGRKRGAEALRESREGWPKPDTTWNIALGGKYGRRFDEPGMELKFKPCPWVKRSGW